MSRSIHTEAQIIGAVNQVEAEPTRVVVCSVERILGEGHDHDGSCPPPNRRICLFRALVLVWGESCFHMPPPRRQGGLPSNLSLREGVASDSQNILT